MELGKIILLAVTKKKTMKKIAILQSNYLPWKGYFDLIDYVDEFIIYDDVQYTRRDWRNRNKIKTPQGLKWITVPVKVKGKYNQLIKDVEIDGSDWASEHWNLIIQNYKTAPFFDRYASEIRTLLTRKHGLLSDLNLAFINYLCEKLAIDTEISQSSTYHPRGHKTDRLLSICENSGADVYVSGPAAKNYLEVSKFTKSRKEVEWFSYDGYSSYNQLWGAFEHGVSVLDLLFCCGENSEKWMLKSNRKK